MGKLFGTDGIRGIANKDLTAELAFKTGQKRCICAYKTFFKKTENTYW